MLTSILRGLQPVVQPPAPPLPAAEPEPHPQAVAPVQDSATDQTAADNPNTGSGRGQPQKAKAPPPRSAAMELAMTAPPGAASLAAAIKTQIESDPDNALAYARRLALGAQTRAQVEGYLDRMRPGTEPAPETQALNPAIAERAAGGALNRRA